MHTFSTVISDKIVYAVLVVFVYWLIILFE